MSFFGVKPPPPKKNWSKTPSKNPRYGLDKLYPFPISVLFQFRVNIFTVHAITLYSIQRFSAILRRENWFSDFLLIHVKLLVAIQNPGEGYMKVYNAERSVNA
jgi:hypothetical protein